MKGLCFTGHSKDFSLEDALHDAAQQAFGTAPTDGVEFHVVGIRGRLGGPGRPRDLWVEIRLGQPEDDDSEERFTTMMVGEEGGEDAPPRGRPGKGKGRPGQDGDATTMAVGEEGGEDAPETDRPDVTTLALGEEGGEAAR
jgi:hypothetical protein